MLDSIVSIIAPHSCLGCSKTGYLVCRTCVAELIEERAQECLGCGAVCDDSGLCAVCRPAFGAERALHFGERSGIPETLVNQYKFSRKRSAAGDIAGLLATLLPFRLPKGAVLVPIPTIGRHIRQRGYDHTLLIARKLARQKQVVVRPVLVRIGEGIQYGASKQVRMHQAADAFTVKEKLDKDRLYIIVDDVVTTGATVRSAVRELRMAGARRIWVLALVRQPLDARE